VDGFDTIRAKFWTRVVISSDHDVVCSMVVVVACSG